MITNPEPALKDRNRSARPLAIVTGASTGIGYELAKKCAVHGFDLLVAADQPTLTKAARDFEQFGVNVEAVEVDLSTTQGVDRLLAAVTHRPVDALLANAGHGLGKAFLDQDFAEVRHVVDTNIVGTLYLVHRVGREMRNRGSGRILITGSIAGFMPGTYQAVYNSTKAFIDMFAYALRAELQGCGVTVTCLMPGATETEFFQRARLMDTRIGQAEKDDPADVAERGFKSMMRGDGGVVTGWQNKLQVVLSKMMPASIVAGRHAREAAPGSGLKD
jgi:uncharacterized protein